MDAIPELEEPNGLVRIRNRPLNQEKMGDSNSCFFFFLFVFLGPHLQHVEIPRLGV